jgi:transcription elongation factor Elf1
MIKLDCPYCERFSEFYTTTDDDGKTPVIVCDSCGYVEQDQGVIGAAKLSAKQLAEIARQTILDSPV